MKIAVFLPVLILSLTASAGKPKALLVMLDGARADALDAARMPAVQSLRDGSWAPGY